MMCSSALNSRGKPVVSPMSGGPTFDIEKKNRNGANLKLRHALRAGGVIMHCLLASLVFPPKFLTSINTRNNTVTK